MYDRIPVKTILAGLVIIAPLIAGCDDGDDTCSTCPESGEFSITLNDLPVLGSGHYGAWASFPESDENVSLAGPLQLLHDELELISLGAFQVTADGEIQSLHGGQMTFSLAEPRDLNLVVEILVSFQADSDTTGPILLGGDVTGDDRTGIVQQMTTGHGDAIGADLRGESVGAYILATPTDGEGSNEARGIWFADRSGPAERPSLGLPELGESWIYHAWIEHGGETFSVGRLVNGVGSADSDSAGTGAGPQAGFDLPGSDFIVQGFNLADGTTEVFITIEAEHHAEEGERLAGRRHAEPFPIRVLEATIPAAVEPGISQSLNVPSTPLPTGSATFTR